MVVRYYKVAGADNNRFAAVTSRLRWESARSTVRNSAEQHTEHIDRIDHERHWAEYSFDLLAADNSAAGQVAEHFAGKPYPAQTVPERLDCQTRHRNCRADKQAHWGEDRIEQEVAARKEKPAWRMYS